MSNDVVNVFFIECHGFALKRIESAVVQLEQDLQAGLKLGEGRTRWEPNWEYSLRFVSAWSPDFGLHDQLTTRLAAIDSSVIVTSHYVQEFGELVGVRIAAVSGDAVVAVEDNGALDCEESASDEELEKATTEVLEQCQVRAKVSWADRSPFPVELVDLDALLLSTARTGHSSSTST